MNHRHADFQSAALPTELSGHFRSLKNLRFWRAGLFGAPKVSGVITSCSDMASAIAKFFDSFFTAPVDGWKVCPAKAGLRRKTRSWASAGPAGGGAAGAAYAPSLRRAARPSAIGTTATSAAMTGEEAKMRLASDVTATERTTVMRREFSRSRSCRASADL